MKLFINNQEKYIFIVSIISQIADILTTYIALHKEGMYETVKLSKCMIEHGYYLEWITYKLLLIGFIYFIYKYTNQKILLYLLLVLAIYVLYIAGHNIYLIM